MVQSNRPLKILQVIDRLDAGGAERVMVDLSQILHDQGQIVTTLAILNHGALGHCLNDGIRKVDLNRSGHFEIRPMKTLQEEANSHDIIHVHMRHNLKYVWFVGKLFPFTAQLVFHDHFGRIDIDQSVPVTLRWSLNEAMYVGVSRQLVRWATARAGIPVQRVFYLPNIILKKDVRSTQPPPRGHNRLVLVSNIRREKNIEFAIRLLKDLKDTGPVTLTLYGKVVDIAYFEELKALIRKLGLQEQISFVNDCLDIQAELPKYQLALHTAISETGPLVLIEYLAQGIPFVCYDTGEVVRQIRKDVGEFILSEFDPESWLERIQHLLRVPAQPPFIGLYHKYYSAEAYYKKCLEIYHKSLAS